MSCGFLFLVNWAPLYFTQIYPNGDWVPLGGKLEYLRCSNNIKFALESNVVRKFYQTFNPQFIYAKEKHKKGAKKLL